MWKTESSIEAQGVQPEQVWKALENMLTGVTASSGGVYAVEGAFKKGSKVSVTPTGQDPVTSEIVELDPPTRYADLTEMEGLRLTFRHVIRDVPGGVRVTKQLEIDGPEADQAGPHLGPQISADFPQTLAELVEQATSAFT